MAATVFGLVDLNLLKRVNRLLKPHRIRLRVQTNKRAWGDQVMVSVEQLGDAAPPAAETPEESPEIV